MPAPPVPALTPVQDVVLGQVPAPGLMPVGGPLSISALTPTAVPLPAPALRRGWAPHRPRSPSAPPLTPGRARRPTCERPLLYGLMCP